MRTSETDGEWRCTCQEKDGCVVLLCDAHAKRQEQELAHKMSAWTERFGEKVAEPIQMLLYCPECGRRHNGTMSRTFLMGNESENRALVINRYINTYEWKAISSILSVVDYDNYERCAEELCKNGYPAEATTYDIAKRR